MNFFWILSVIELIQISETVLKTCEDIRTKLDPREQPWPTSREAGGSWCYERRPASSAFLLNPSVSVSALMTLIDFTLSNARRFYSSMGNPSDTEGLTERKQDLNISESCSEWKFVKYLPSTFRAKTL